MPTSFQTLCQATGVKRQKKLYSLILRKSETSYRGAQQCVAGAAREIHRQLQTTDEGSLSETCCLLPLCPFAPNCYSYLELQPWNFFSLCSFASSVTICTYEFNSHAYAYDSQSLFSSSYLSPEPESYIVIWLWKHQSTSVENALNWTHNLPLGISPSIFHCNWQQRHPHCTPTLETWESHSCFLLST